MSVRTRKGCLFFTSFCLGLGMPFLLWAASVSLADLGDFLGIFLLRKEFRSSHDTAVVQRLKNGEYAVEITLWNPIQSQGGKQEVCDAYSWLLFGRGNLAKGAKEAFSKFPTLREIYLRFFEKEFGTRPGSKKGEFIPFEKLVPYLRVGISRNSIEKKGTDWKQLKKLLKEGSCETAKPYLDLSWVDRNYVR